MYLVTRRLPSCGGPAAAFTDTTNEAGRSSTSCPKFRRPSRERRMNRAQVAWGHGAPATRPPSHTAITTEETPMSRESDWAVFEKACEITASAVRGTMSGADGQQASFVADVFRSVHDALKTAADEMPNKDSKAGF
jgi:hypothetical protein